MHAGAQRYPFSPPLTQIPLFFQPVAQPRLRSAGRSVVQARRAVGRISQPQADGFRAALPERLPPRAGRAPRGSRRRRAEASAAFIRFAVSQLTCRLIVLRIFFSTFCISSIARGRTDAGQEISTLAPSLKYRRQELPRRACLGDSPKSSSRLVSSPQGSAGRLSAPDGFLSGPATVPAIRNAPRRKAATQQSFSSTFRLRW